jgi:hypothetical protein
MATRCRTIHPGRLSSPIRVFVARLMAEVHGVTIKRATAIVDRAPGCLWAAAVDAHTSGCRTLRDFEQWTGETLTQLSK